MVKLIHCDGRDLEVRDVGPVIYRLRAGPAPIKWNGWKILEDDPARDLLRRLRAEGAESVK